MIKGKVKLYIGNKTTVKASQAVKIGKHKVAIKENKSGKLPRLRLAGITGILGTTAADGRITAVALGSY